MYLDGRHNVCVGELLGVDGWLDSVLGGDPGSGVHSLWALSLT